MNRCTKKAFTLVELLVVIGIISVLMTLMLPMLGRVMEQSRTILCKNKMRQLGVAMALFSRDNRQRFPFYWHPDYPHPNPPDDLTRTWNYVGLQYDAQIAPYLNLAPRRPTPGEEFYCKTSTTPTYVSGLQAPAARTNSYNYNTHLGRDRAGSGRMYNLKDPTRTMVLTELLWDGRTNWFLWGGCNQPNQSHDPVGRYHTIAYHHNDTTNILFGDLHVAAREPALPGNPFSYPKNTMLYNDGPEY